MALTSLPVSGRMAPTLRITATPMPRILPAATRRRVKAQSSAVGASPGSSLGAQASCLLLRIGCLRQPAGGTPASEVSNLIEGLASRATCVDGLESDHRKEAEMSETTSRVTDRELQGQPKLLDQVRHREEPAGCPMRIADMSLPRTPGCCKMTISINSGTHPRRSRSSKTRRCPANTVFERTTTSPAQLGRVCRAWHRTGEVKVPPPEIDACYL
jgi:hypothetical protein